jgi:hypothetical protein
MSLQGHKDDRTAENMFTSDSQEIGGETPCLQRLNFCDVQMTGVIRLNICISEKSVPGYMFRGPGFNLGRYQIF